MILKMSFYIAKHLSEYLKARVREKYLGIQARHPALPASLKDFQVQFGIISSCWWLDPHPQVDILAAVVDPEESHHVFSGFPTAYGKSLPQMLVSLLSPSGSHIGMQWTLWQDQHSYMAFQEPQPLLLLHWPPSSTSSKLMPLDMASAVSPARRSVLIWVHSKVVMIPWK